MNRMVYKATDFSGQNQPTALVGATQGVIEDLEGTLRALKAEIEQKKIERDALIAQFTQRAQKEAEAKKSQIIESARQEGIKIGRDEGVKKGEEEGLRIIKKAESILNEARIKRREIIKEAEAEIVEVIILIAEKVVKERIGENKEIVLAQAKAALSKLTAKEEITIRANMDDLNLLEAHRKEFLTMVSGLREIKFLDDPGLEPGGIRIETDFGYVDASIKSQLDEVKRNLLEAADLSEEGEDKQ
ncbi:hypothetical protein KJ693_00590 [bacterium]|nr:hypothetical protein [bacterium]MBU1613787.1 hypothetical protein [bacterium]